MNRPNIFNYATKELSQDAMICWFLECLNSEDEEYRKLGLNFVRFIFENEKIENAELFDETFPKTQYKKIDVYAEIVINGTVHPVIFEDKTNTYLHNDQLYKYIEKIDSETKSKAGKKRFNKVELGDILYVYFKTGFASEWELKDIKDKQNDVAKDNKKRPITNVNFREIYLKEMVSFLNNQSLCDILFTDYVTYLNKLYKVRKEALNKYATSIPNCLDALDKENQAISILLLNKVFGKDCYIEYTANKKLAIAYPFYSVDENGKIVFYNLGITGENGKYYFRLEQWQKENELYSTRKKAEEIQSFCQKLAEDDKAFEFKTLSKQLNKSYKIFKLHISKKHSVEGICETLKSFIDRIIAEFGFEELDVTKEKDWENK